jgi:Cupin domain
MNAQQASDAAKTWTTRPRDQATPAQSLIGGRLTSSPRHWDGGSDGTVEPGDNPAEHFEVLEGRIAFVVDGKEQTLGAGERITVEPGGWHRWWNAGEGEVRARVRVEPTLRFQEAILVLWGLCADGHTNKKGTPSPLLGALLATRYRDEIRFRPPPQLVQRMLFPLLAGIARRRGMDQTIERYLDLDAHPSAEVGLNRLPQQVMRRARA